MTLMMMTVLPHRGPKLTRHRRPASTSRRPSARDSVDCMRGHASALFVLTREYLPHVPCPCPMPPREKNRSGQTHCKLSRQRNVCARAGVPAVASFPHRRQQDPARSRHDVDQRGTPPWAQRAMQTASPGRHEDLVRAPAMRALSRNAASWLRLGFHVQDRAPSCTPGATARHGCTTDTPSTHSKHCHAPQRPPAALPPSKKRGGKRAHHF